MFGPTEYIVSTEPRIPQCTAGATAGRTLTWEVSMTTDSLREVFRGWVAGLDATTIENETLKKASDCVTQPSVTLWFPSHTSALLLFYDTIFKCAFTCAVHIWQSEDTCWYTPMCKTPRKHPSWRIRRITLKPKPPRWQRRVQFCRHLWLVCFSVPLCCPAVLPDQTPAGWYKQRHCDPLTCLWHQCLSFGWRTSRWNHACGFS